ncbi:MAG: hypothetical protein HOP03_17840 [Lysobacter sp.]|nr:hypothetical protein [Lysobacter sp.]
MKTDRKSRSNRKAPLITSLALACAFAAGNAGAGIPVTDLGNMPNHIITQINSLLNQINTYTQKFQDYTQYAREIQHMTQQLTQLDQLFNTLALSMTPITEKTSQDLSDAIAQRCSGGSSSMISDIFSTIGLDMNGDIIGQQKTKCKQIVNLQFMQFNEQVRMLNKLRQTQSQIERIQGQMAGSSGNGQMDTNVAQTAKLTAQVLADAQYTETVIKTYEGMIKMVEEDQRQLAKRGMKGENSVIGTIVSTAALAGALEIN